jgi:polyisoprenoid-binding protein YceI
MIKSYFKYVLLAALLLSLNNINAQVLSFDHGKVEFYTKTVLSDIDAITEKAVVKLDTKTGSIEVSIEINSFEFEYEMMQEHFNEEYLESDKFPQATFKGKILQDVSSFEEEIDIDASGELTIHGITKEIRIKANISKAKDFTLVKFKIPVTFKDFNVEEPSILSKSVAKDVEVKGLFYLK